MTNYQRIALILGFVMVFTLAKWGPFVFAHDDEFNRPTLRGLKGVYVLVEQLRPEIERGGLSKNQIQTDVELKLRMAGIKVLSKEESFDAPGRPWLYVNVNAFKAEDIGAYVYHVLVELNQDVYLARRPPDFTKYKTSTWSVSYLGIKSKLGDIRASVKDLVDMFINAYLSVNPK